MTLEEEGARRRAEQQMLKQPRAQLLEERATPQADAAGAPAGWDGASTGAEPL
jgi:hypothetical protein